jgi:two-component system cell cycle sensor histidine kinase/response regulator CckA
MKSSLLALLFAEDTREDLELVQRKLADIAVVKGANSRASFIEALKQPLDVILIDFHLVDLDGTEAIQIARAAKPHVPILIVTGSLDDYSASAACQGGAVDYLLKDRLGRLRQAVLSAYENNQRIMREMRNQRLELLGELVVGIAHDMNNLLGVMLAGVEILRSKISPQDERILDVMASTARRGAEMQKQMLAFGRGGDGGELHRVSTEYLITEIGAMLRGTFPSNIRLLIRTSAGTAQVRCDETQINQALLNLCINARDAMPGGGELVISAQNVTLRKPEGQYVCISVKDTGTGISENALPRIFEPFFTTKGPKGTGLGLALVKQIIAAHGGLVDVNSKPGQGTEFQIYLPIALDAEDRKAQEAVNADGKGKTILLVEDTEFLLAWMRMTLEEAHYKVLDACSGSGAMKLFLAHMETISLVVSDIAMPLMSGPQLARALLELRPGLPIVFITGLDSGSEAITDPMPAATLHKPFTSQKLTETIRRVLTAGDQTEHPAA